MLFLFNSNILTEAAEQAAIPVPSLAEGGKLMSTYEEFMIILTTGLLIVEILNMKNKK